MSCSVLISSAIISPSIISIFFFLFLFARVLPDFATQEVPGDRERVNTVKVE